MLLECGVQACLPDARDLDEALAIYHSFPGFEEKAAESGVLALDVEPIVKSDGDGVLHLPDAARE
jgi:ASC-1-like (ASCH) protein